MNIPWQPVRHTGGWYAKIGDLALYVDPPDSYGMVNWEIIGAQGRTQTEDAAKAQIRTALGLPPEDTK